MVAFLSEAGILQASILTVNDSTPQSEVDALTSLINGAIALLVEEPGPPA